MENQPIINNRKDMKLERNIHSSVLLAAALAACLTVASCSGSKSEAGDEDGVETVLPSEQPEVTVTELRKQTFHHEIVSNGKATAGRYADVSFRSATNRIEHIYVKNGDHVAAGQKLAELNTFTLQNSLTQAESGMSQAYLELQDVLIGQGYNPDKMDEVPADVLKLARVKSGYETSTEQVALARFELENATLTAPISGVVANLFTKEMNLPETGTPFCRIVDNSGMDVEFSILESELALVKRGDEVKVKPYALPDKEYSGRVTEINPIVDSNGMVTLKAEVNGDRDLFDGMNVRVSLLRDVPDQFVVPKSAVVLRSNRQVMFTLKDGEAQWNYVTTGLENATEYTVTGETLEEGMEVITSGNLNLAHETKVTVAATDGNTED